MFIWVLLSLCAIAWGAFQAFAGSMSDDPIAGEDAGKTGCGIAIAGIVSLIIGLVVWLVR